jgi:hypothetical protein
MWRFSSIMSGGFETITGGGFHQNTHLSEIPTSCVFAYGACASINHLPLYTITVYGIIRFMVKLKTVTANASRQARFAERQKQSGKIKLTLWVSNEDSVAVRNWLNQRKEQKKLVALTGTDTVAPENPLLMPKSGKCRTVITLCRPDTDLLTLRSADFDDKLAPMLKSLRGFAWKKPLWERKLTDVFTPADDQAVEIGVRLLDAGYALRITDEALKTRILNNDYQPAPQRIVSPSISEKYGKKFKLSWDVRDKEVKKAIGLIQNVKMFLDGAYVPLLQFEAVFAIAEQFGFLFRPGVDELMAEAEAEYARSVGVSARPKHHKHTDMPNLIEQKPPGEINVEFLDD